MSPVATMTARSMTFSSSRTLPGHGYRIRAPRLSGEMSRTAFLMRRPACSTKCRASSGMSSGRSRSAGTRTGMTERR